MKNTRRFTSLFLICFLSFFLSSCSDTHELSKTSGHQIDRPDRDPDNILSNWNAFHGDDVTGTVMLYSLGPAQSDQVNSRMTAAFYDENEQPGEFGSFQLNDIPFQYIDEGKVFIPDFGIEIGKEYRERFYSKMNKVWGHSNRFSFYTEKGERAVEAEMYIPQLLNPIQIISATGDVRSIQSGTQIVWNQDDNNKDVMIEASYDPNFYPNDSESEESNEGMRVYKVIPDQGNYRVKDSDLEAFPTGAWVSFTLHRGSFTKMRNAKTNDFYSVGAWSEKEITLKVLK